MTVTDRLTDPPGPVHARPNVVVEDNPLMVWDPEPALVPDQPPLAVQVVTDVPVQLRTVLAPSVTELGAALNDKVGVGGS